MDYRVRNLRQMQRGFEADVTLGTEGPPGASVTMKVLITHADPDFKKIRGQLERLLSARAQAVLVSTVEYAQQHGYGTGLRSE
jgi:hypothetical protein